LDNKEATKQYQKYLSAAKQYRAYFIYLSPFAVYVALSRGHGRDTIMLRDFDHNIFHKHPSQKEDVR
jgi:hypothetical protein